MTDTTPQGWRERWAAKAEETPSAPPLAAPTPAPEPTWFGKKDKAEEAELDDEDEGDDDQ